MLDDLEQQIMNCEKCSRLRKVTPHPMPHITYVNNIDDVKIMGIGRNPGLEYDTSQISDEEFMDYYREKWWGCRVGTYMRKRLGDDVISNAFFFTNICKCSSPNNSPLIKKEKENCFPYLQKQIEIVQPQVIITFSSDTRNMLQSYIKDRRYIIDDKTIPVFFMYHPSYFKYSPDRKLSKKQDTILNEIRMRIE